MAKTKDYGLFKTIGGNRDVKSRHVNKLVRSIEQKNLLKHHPILVNESMFIIDGQHRLQAAQALGVDIYYEVVPGLNLKDVMALNSNTSGWKLKDFINSYRRIGNPEYEELEEFINDYGLNTIPSASLLAGKKVISGGGHLSEDIRGGTFKVTDRDRAHLVADLVNRLAEHSTDNLQKDREFIRAINLLVDNENFNAEQLVDTLKTSGWKIIRQFDYKRYVLHLEELYNFKKSKNAVNLYATSQVDPTRV